LVTRRYDVACPHELIFLAIDNIILGLCGKIILPVNFLERRKSQEVLAEFINSLLFLITGCS